MSKTLWPDWWQWELELSPHLLKRMIDRDFGETDLRRMMEDAIGYRSTSDTARFVVESRHDERSWEIIVEPDRIRELLIVVTAYPTE